MDIVYIRDLRIETIIGIFDWERRCPQTISLDIEMGCDIRKAAETDDIAHALDYKSVSKRLIQFVSEADFQLVERLTEEIAKLIMSEFTVPWVRIVLNKKGAVRGSRDVGIIIERGSKD